MSESTLHKVCFTPHTEVYLSVILNPETAYNNTIFNQKIQQL